MTIYERDARLYDMIYGGDDADALSFVRWLLTYLDISDDDRLLDMGAGTGSMLIPLTADGYSVQGMEPYDLMRQRARVKADHQGVDIDLSQGSFQTLDHDNEFDLIMAMNGPLHYIEPEELDLVLDKAAAALTPGGYLLTDTINFYSLIKNYEYPEPLEFEIDGLPAIAMIEHQVDISREKWINRVVLFYKDQEYQRFDDTQEMSMYTLTHLDYATEKAGFERSYFFSSYFDRPDERAYGSRLIPIYRKV